MNQATTYAAVLKKKLIGVTAARGAGRRPHELFTPEVAAAPIVAFARSLSR